MPWLELLFLASIFFEASKSQNVICGSRTTRTITVDENESFIFKTQRGRIYSKGAKCLVNYRLGSSCEAITVMCSKFSVQNKDKVRCRKGDKMVVSSQGKSKWYCATKGPKATYLSHIRILFTSDSRIQTTGATCRVRCSKAVPKAPPEVCKCGRARRSTRMGQTGKIVGGTITEVNEYPWQVGIVNRGTTFIFCGASLISDRWVLTAAHCTYRDVASNIQALLGEHDYSTPSETTLVRRNIVQIVNHPSYSHYTTNYDFSLLKLAGRLNFKMFPHIRPICLPLDDSNDYNDFLATVTGWGTTSSGGSISNKLREVQVKVMTNTECKDSSYPASWITSQMMCANVPGGGKDACQGDSGGPLVAVEEGSETYTLVGVVSWGSGCAQERYPGVYARVTEQIQWIQQTTASTGKTCPRE